MTGEEQKLLQGARHMACTVEMVPVDTRVDVAVVDEIQVRVCDAAGMSVLGVPCA